VPVPADHLEGVGAELSGQAVEVAPEDCAQHDLERELAHLVGEVHQLALGSERFPALEAAVIRRRDDAANSVMTRRWKYGCIM